MTKLIRAVVAHWLFWALFASALMLAIAHAFETFGGYAPCTLCLIQRNVYWTAGTIALAGALATRLPSLGKIRWLFDAALAVTFAVGVGYAVYHSGAEWKWWPGPTTCSGTGGAVNLDSLAAIVDGTAKIKPPACDEAAWRFLGLSMAGWNVLISLKLVFFSVWAALSDRKRA